MDVVYVVFDQLPTSRDGGLVATYASFVREFAGELEVKLVSAFGCEPTDIDAFEGLEVIELTSVRIDNRFPEALGHLRAGRLGRFAYALRSGLLFFLLRPLLRRRSRRLLAGKPVIASSPAAAMFLDARVRFVLEVHSSYEFFWGDNPTGRLQTALMAPPQLTLFRNASDARRAEGRFRAGYLYNGFDDRGLPPLPAEPAPKPPRALFVGRLVESKDPAMLLRCAALTAERVPGFALDVYGDGPLRGALERQIVHMGLQDVVSLKGFTADKAVYRDYAVLWLTSTNEGFGLVIIEAAANGVPTVSTEWGPAVHEVIADGQTGHVVRTDEELVERTAELLGDPKALAAFSRRARERFEGRFTAERHKRAWEEVLSREFGLLLGAGGGDGGSQGEPT